MTIGLSCRLDPSFGALSSALDAGEIGTAEWLSITSLESAAGLCGLSKAFWKR